MSNTDINDNENPEFDVQDDAEIAAIDDFDFDRVEKLLSIIEKVATVAPRNTSILGIAQAELTIMNDKARDIARARAERIREAEQRRYEAEVARVAEENEAQIEAQGDQVEALDQRRVSGPSLNIQQPAEPPPGPGQPSTVRRI